MEKDRKIKILSIIALVLAVVGMSLGFAAFSISLNISSNASVSPDSSTFGVKFSTNKDSLVVADVTPSSISSGLTATNGVIDNSSNPTIKNLSVTFTNPGQYVEYTFYARNEGEYTAYLNNINFLGNKTCTGESGTTDSLVQSACTDINITASVAGTTYTETTPITGHTLAKGVGEEIIVKLEYSSTGASVDGAFSITFPNVALVYSSVDDSTIQPSVEKVVNIVSGDYDTVGSEVCIDTECFYVISSTTATVTMLSKYNLYVGGVFNGGWIAYGDEATGKQDSTMIGWVSGQSISNGTTAFSSSSQKGTKYSDYSGSIVEGYVNNYNTYLESLGVDIQEARLITLDELETLGCSSTDLSCSGAPTFVYSTSYWSGSAYNSINIWYVDSYTHFHNNHNYANVMYFGVRPVITISKS